MKSNKSWFDVDLKGLRALQAGKSKSFIIRELVQNAMDEDITTCDIKISRFDDGITYIIVEDDSPEGFRDLSHAYTLYANTYKRKDPTKRGRFNLGEKQVLALCNCAKIITTKGTVTFDKKGRTEKTGKIYSSKSGSCIEITLKTSKKEYDEIIEYANHILVPKGVVLIVNGKVIEYIEPYKTFEARLTTENEEGGTFKRTVRKTDVQLVRTSDNINYLYELGIPVQVIDCEYGINVQQKVPLSSDRDCVLDSFLRDCYSEVLNNTYSELTPEIASEQWVRQASSDERIESDAVKAVIKQRFGDKVAILNPRDPIANDEALSRGFKLISGSEMSAEEWGNVKNNNLMQSSTALFGMQFVDSKPIEPTWNMKFTAELARKIAKECLNIDVDCKFVESPKATILALYGNRTITFNVTLLNKQDFFKGYLTSEQLDLIMHELAHENGHHTDKSYHECLSEMGANLIVLALRSPKFFEEI